MLSVIIPNYNHAHLIGRAIDAILKQSARAEEIIIVDDGSTDHSRGVISAYASRLPQIKAIFQERNHGLVASIARGIDLSTQRYIYLAASDDWVEAGFFATAIAMLESNPQAALFCGEVKVVDGQTGDLVGIRPPVRPLWRAGYVDPTSVSRTIRGKGHWVVGCGTIYRRDHLLAAGGLDPELGSFADGFLARRLALAHGFCFAPQIVATWVTYATSLSRQAAQNIDRATTMLNVVNKKMAAEPSFPPTFADTYSNLWRFSTARLALQARPVDHDMLVAMAGQTTTDRAVLKTIWTLLPDSLAHFVSLCWLWLRLRPYSLAGLVRTAIVRRLESRNP